MFFFSGGILAALAFALLITSIVFAFQVSVVFGSFYTLFIALIAPIFLWFVLRAWPKTWMGRQLLLTPEEDPALNPNEELQALKRLIGKHGMAKSKMLLGGLIEIEGSKYSAVSDVEPIEAGDPICVVRIEGTSIIVRKLNLKESPAAATESSSLDDPFA